MRAFTLVEIMVVVTIIALLAAVGIPYIVHAKQVSRANILANDLRTISQWFINYTQQEAIYPPDSGTKEIPVGMETYVTSKWLEPTAIGGCYNYEFEKTAQGTQYKVGIGIRDDGTNLVTTDVGLLTTVDRLIDDGDLTTGSFLLGPGNSPFYVVER
ncbi:MAG: type II secretion system GspH family protein [Cephaloticoccus sp.]|nr:type II secretion system GspH family protein [Cephaloticoccus sp.]MCF7760185.1 type II secretion system GspH family protein [Cephaloticoccus sp.]